MKRLVLALAGIAALIATSGAVPALAQNAAEAAGDPNTVVARVGDVEIKAKDVAEAYGQLPPEYRQVPLSAVYGQLIEQLIGRQLMLQAGLAQKLDEDEEVLAQVSAFTDRAIQHAYLQRLIEAAVTEDDLRAQYDSTIGAGEGKEEVKASHILLQSEDEAKAVIDELEDGADFAQLARDRSTGPSASQGGDLGYFVREQMVPPFADAAFALDEGETTADPVKTQFGWHVIKVTGRRTLPPPGFDEVREQLHDQLTRKAVAAHMAELQNATTIERFNPDGTPMDDKAGAR